MDELRKLDFKKDNLKILGIDGCGKGLSSGMIWALVNSTNHKPIMIEKAHVAEFGNEKAFGSSMIIEVINDFDLTIIIPEMELTVEDEVMMRPAIGSGISPGHNLDKLLNKCCVEECNPLYRDTERKCPTMKDAFHKNKRSPYKKNKRRQR